MVIFVLSHWSNSDMKSDMSLSHYDKSLPCDCTSPSEIRNGIYQEYSYASAILIIMFGIYYIWSSLLRNIITIRNCTDNWVKIDFSFSVRILQYQALALKSRNTLQKPNTNTIELYYESRVRSYVSSDNFGICYQRLRLIRLSFN